MDFAANWPWLLAGIVVLLALYAWFTSTQSGKSSDPWHTQKLPYRKVASLLTPSEMKFYNTLRAAVGSEYYIAMKVRMADVLQVAKGTAEFRSYQNRIQQKHVDFVLCDPSTLAPLLVIELDDPSHEQPDRRERDTAVDAMMAAADLPILHLPTARTYDLATLTAKIQQARQITQLPVA